MTEKIKLLLLKTNPKIFDIIDFHNDHIFRNPLIFAFFNNPKAKKEVLDSILYGYIDEGLRPEKLTVVTDSYGRIYLTNIGWFHTKFPNENLELRSTKGIISFRKGKEKIGFKFEKIELIPETGIELLKYPISFLENLYYDYNFKLVKVEIESITKIHRKNLYKAWALIKKFAPEHYDLINLTSHKCVVFNIDTKLRNSFAAFGAQGIAFFNAYQNDYNEVFFIDDIAHQTGHLIFNILTYNIQRFIKISPNTTVEELGFFNSKNKVIAVEKRNILTLFHALFTYYATFICLDACLNANVFEKQKRHEALGRIATYILKSKHDIALVEQSKNELFTENGLIIYNEIYRICNLMEEKWGIKVNDFNLSNQPYNFTFSKFLELNPLI